MRKSGSAMDDGREGAEVGEGDFDESAGSVTNAEGGVVVGFV